MSQPNVDVAPLHCAACGAPVPVGAEDDDVVPCRACATKCNVPPAVARLRSVARAEGASRARAQALADELAAPPGFFMSLWMTASALAGLGVALVVVVWLVVGLVICVGMIWNAGLDAVIAAILAGLVLSVPLVHSEILHYLASPLGVDLADTLGGALSYALLGASFYVLLALPSILGDYATSFETVRATLRKVLSARAPATKGGPAECRNCGAALEVVQGTLHARCLYCSTDNLVDVPAELVARASDDAESKHRHVETAHDEADELRREGQRRAWKQAGSWALGLVGAFVVLGRIVAAINGDGPTFWTRATEASAIMIPNVGKNPRLSRDTTTSFDAVYDRCSDTTCDAYYFVALDKGQTVAVTTTGPLELARLDVRKVGKWYNPTYEWVPAEVAASDFAAPYRGLYRVVLQAPKRSRGTPTITWKRK